MDGAEVSEATGATDVAVFVGVETCTASTSTITEDAGVGAGSAAPSYTVTTSSTTAVLITWSITVFKIGLATMLAANRSGVRVEERMMVPNVASDKDGSWESPDIPSGCV